MSGRPPLRDLRQTSFERDAVATMALALYSFVVAIGFARVFSGWDFLGDLAVLILVGHGVSFLLRRAQVNGWIAVPAMTVVLGWVLTLYRYRENATWLLPGRDTWSHVRLDVALVRDQFQTAVAPVVYEVGWATLAGVAMIIVIVMADAFAFRAEARGEALVPGGVLFIFVAALGTPRLRVMSSMLLVGAGIVAVIALRALHDRTRRIELTTGRRRTSTVIPAAIGSAVVVAAVAGYLGPRLPGADADPWYETRGRGGGITEVASPLVDIRSRLVNQGNVELFRVNADAEAYWRVTTLPEFDGRTFRLPQRKLTRIDTPTTAAPAERTVRQQVQIIGLGEQLLPAAADPTAIRPNENIRFEQDTSTLFKTSDLRPGETYTIISVVPDVSLASLEAAQAINPPDPVFLELPDNLPSVVRSLAEQVTAGAATDYGKMRALQDWFQTFDYSTEVQAGHSSSAIESFLEIKEGYCEQFSATFAAMARTLDIPSRVAVGYTPGLLGDDGWYSVLGKNSHAWPEIWFEGIGWVAFEPTPSRGIPGATDYTGLQPAQDTTPGVTGPADRDRPAASTPPAPNTVFAPPTTTRTSPQFDDPEARRAGTGAAAPAASASDGGGFPWRGLALLVALLLGVAMPPVVRRWRRRAARHHGPGERVGAAWSRACRSALRAGVDGRPSMTSREWAAATATHLPVAARPMLSLADAVDRFEFARPDAIASNASLGRDCELWAEQISRIAADTLTNRERAKVYFTDLH
jgi:transglutaminase-like putative cysteine protease